MLLLGAEGFEYNESGNNYSIKYTNENGTHELAGVYDEKADWLKCTAKTNGEEILVSEYRKTSYGYAAQYYSVGDKGTFVYMITISGNDGVVGISESTTQPSELTGSEDINSPKQCDTWYEIKNNVVTGPTASGKEFSFTYTPSKE